ncbi:MAG: putative photosynthetic complex assembly protein PuhE [Hyphomicrobiaceae bacterium]|nr:putative photosynthetic complex assembly protein PuhE [Hyphomicrobiaceae bacterium]
MLEVLAPVVFAVLLWWSSTAALLMLDRLPRSTYGASLAAGTVLAGIGVVSILMTADERTETSAYVGFVGAILVWAWHEMSFLFGLVTGPRREACPPGASGWQRFRLATATLITHEIAILLTAIALLALTWGAENATAMTTFAVLWVMRLSAKLNIFLGVPNLSDDLMPAHLDYLKSYFARRPMNALFPVSVTFGTLAACWFALTGLTAGDDPHMLTAGLLIATLLALAVLEHWFLVLPVPDAALWMWAVPDEEARPPASEERALPVIGPLASGRSRRASGTEFDADQRHETTTTVLSAALVGATR